MSNHSKHLTHNSKRYRKRIQKQLPQKQLQQEQQDKQQNQPEAEISTTTMLKLVVRSKYWGRKLEGKLRRSQANPQNAYRVISSQAIADKIGTFWGCCPHHGRRVLELREGHFLEHNSGNWDLYFVASIPASGNVYHELFLLPQDQTDIDIEKHVSHDGWKMLGTIKASVALSDLGSLLEPYLSENRKLERTKNHVHIQILMNEAIDRQITRSKGKNGRFKQQNEATDEPGDSIVSRPPIPHSVSHDSSWATDTASNVTEDAWPRSLSFCQPTSQWGSDASFATYDAHYMPILPAAMNQHTHPWSLQMQMPMVPNTPWFHATGHCVVPHYSTSANGLPMGFVDPMYGGPEQFVNLETGWEEEPNE